VERKRRKSRNATAFSPASLDGSWPDRLLVQGCGGAFLRQDSPRVVGFPNGHVYAEGALQSVITRIHDDAFEARGEGRPNGTPGDHSGRLRLLRMTDRPKEPLFYVQDSRQVVGNCAAWWCPNSAGYTCDIAEAGLYTAKQTMSMRDTDIPWPKELVEKLVIGHVSVERLHDARTKCPVCKGVGRVVRCSPWADTAPCPACNALGVVEPVPRPE